MSNRNFVGKLMRADKDFISLSRSTVTRRIKNFPKENPRELTDREITRMMKNAPSFPNVLKEMEVLPRKRK